MGPVPRGWLKLGAVAVASMVTGAVLASAVTADAEDSPRPGGAAAAQDLSRPQRPDEKLLTGQTAERIRNAALAEYPGATIDRIETDSDGVYEAHLTKPDGTRVTVELNRSFTVTGEEQMGDGHRGRLGDFDGDDPGDDRDDGDDA